MSDELPAGDDPAIRVRGLRNSFGEQVVHDNLDLDVRRGEIIGVVGGSGTGKTVLLNSIIGLKEPEGGSVSILGHDRAAMTEADEADVQRRTGILFQQGALFSALSVIDNVAFGLLAQKKATRAEARKRADEIGLGLGPFHEVARALPHAHRDLPADGLAVAAHRLLAMQHLQAHDLITVGHQQEKTVAKARAQAQQLLNSGAISQAEFDKLKAKAAKTQTRPAIRNASITAGPALAAPTPIRV